uniref:Secreted protein n=1 Tax=Angiostrongylus cantonensis TaxID=6313 RepID=A0A0K0DFJ9_ANGCA
LWLLTWQAHEDAILPYLNREDVVVVLSYLSLVRSPDYRIGRILRRLASCRLFIDSLLSMQFHMRVFYALCTPPCKVVRYAKRCARCERAADIGREILKVFSAHVDSDFGDSFLIKRLSSDDFTTRIVAAIAKIVLIRDRFRLCRMSYGRLTALELLFESLHSILTEENFHEICEQPTYKGSPPVCAQIVAAISTLIAPQRLRECFQVSFSSLIQFQSQCKFAHLQGMFSSDMLEKCTGRRRFTFCPEIEGCSSEDFTLFLHHLAGCYSACSAIRSPQTCVALVKLSDRYLCPMLSESVCGPHGPARRLLTGETLSVFLPSVLTTQTHERYFSFLCIEFFFIYLILLDLSINLEKCLRKEFIVSEQTLFINRCYGVF